MHVTASVKRVGNSLAIFIPGAQAREARIHEGDIVEADIEPKAPHMLGMFPGLKPWTIEDKRAGWPDEDL